MKTETFGFTIETAYGNKLDTPISASASYDAFESIDEIKQKNEFPSDKEILNFVNAKAKAAARAAQTTKSLDEAGIKKPTLESSPEMRFNTIVKALTAGGLDDATARQQASALTGYNG